MRIIRNKDIDTDILSIRVEDDKMTLTQSRMSEIISCAIEAHMINQSELDKAILVYITITNGIALRKYFYNLVNNTIERWQ